MLSTPCIQAIHNSIYMTQNQGIPFRRATGWLSAGALVFSFVVGCGGAAVGTDEDAATDVVAADADTTGTDAGVDAADVQPSTDVAVDTAPDSVTDAGAAETDAGVDAADAQSATDVAEDVAPDADADAAAVDVALGTDAASPDVAAVTTGTVAVHVVNAAGTALPGALAEIATKSVPTDAQGTALLAVVAAGDALVHVTATGYAAADKMVTVVAGAQTDVSVTLVAVAGTQVILSQAATEVAAGGVSVQLPANAFVDASGAAFAGPVTVTVAPLDPGGNLSGIPGPLVETPPGAMVAVPLEAAFLAEVSFTAPDGSPLQLAPGQTAQLVFPLPPATAALHAVGTTLSAWYFDVAKAAWTPDGAGKVSVDAATGAKVVTLTVSHFTWWAVASNCTLASDCDDSVDCTTDVCVFATGFCEHTTDDALCGDGNECTDNTCAKTGCEKVNNSGGCTDGDACTTGDTCSGGVCSGVNVVCNDSNACTDDSCVAASGCVFTNVDTNPCTDGSLCTAVDNCVGGSCVVVSATNCDDGNACTTDSCAAATGACTSTVSVTPVCGDGTCQCGETNGSCLADCAPSGCENGTCDGDETVASCPIDCGFLLNRLGDACASPGAQDTCAAGFVCVARSSAGGGNVCVADYSTWAPIPDSHPATDFTEAPEYVTDVLTGLSWAKLPEGVMTWDTALTACNSVSYGGFYDWRLPTRAELASLADRTKWMPACSAPNMTWPSTVNPWAQWTYWSGVLIPAFSAAFTVNFFLGDVMSDPTGDASVRCVRSTNKRTSGAGDLSSATGNFRFVWQLGGNAVLDRISGLQWQVEYSGPSLLSCYSALTWCDMVALPGTGWRLPTSHELEELTNPNPSTPSLFALPAYDPLINPASWFLTSTKNDGGGCWGVSSADGSSAGKPTDGGSVRCVR